ncbi:MEDS domain-containing protein [Noviherbaspirillum sedimenti]|uniref:PAS domain S-box protein n=1 Tax=Noviherbaspirillum sedimenti TaxID=2320865 RepID=A0A3A3G8M1_9BURK|nr:MEDS domain-containing protein [Noviherbaspirillum sedimenti]RJG03995.1 PAS domain S-box protein [Noviherbaspirillum sedimenti]
MAEHVVQFYENDQFLIEKVSDFISAGLDAGAAGIVIATAVHLQALEKSLRISSDQENYIALEAESLLSKFMIDGRPHEQRFREVMGDILTQASANGSRRVRAFGEMAALLYATENHAAAIRLEQLWNDLAKDYAFSLLCAYPMAAFSGEEHCKSFFHVCTAHSEVCPAPGKQESPGPADLQRSIALLQQRTHALETEVARRQQAQQLLQESEERFRSLVHMSSDWYWEQDAQMRFTRVFAHRAGASSVAPESMVGMAPIKLSTHWDASKQLAFETAWVSRQPYHDLESCLNTPGSPTRHFRSSGQPMFDAAGQFIGYQGVTKEVTEHVRNIEDLRRFRAAMDATADAIFLVDHGSLMFVDANATACRLVGYTREELLRLSGADLGSVSPEVLRSLSEDLVRGKDRGVETIWMRHKDGSRLSVEMQRHALHSGQDWIIVVVARDITERKRTEAALRQSQEDLRQLAAHQEHIKEEERKCIAREIHDELGGVLTGIKANISVSLARAAGAGRLPDPLLVDSASLADAAIETVRRVITDLRPSVLDQLGVWAALDWYAGQIQERTGLQCRCVVSNSAAITELDPERSTMLFRVVQEALTNVVRHAAASHVTISVLREQDDIVVEIRDDGKGMDMQRLLDGQSWGILGMHERTRHFGGNINIDGTLGKGTAVLLRLPLEQEDVK